MLDNRLRKNLKHLRRWSARQNIYCYRLYDADIPEYSFAVDVYAANIDSPPWVHVQEYAPPDTIDRDLADTRIQDALRIIRDVLATTKDRIFLKVRKTQKGDNQYEKLAAHGNFHEVFEGGCRFFVNFEDYLDTGLFLDHRITRGMLAELAHGKRFLNLFAYTGSATVYAAKGQAENTTTVDMSKTYLDWAQRNMALNGFHGEHHEFVQADCLKWLQQSTRLNEFGLIFLDPPSFSTSKRMQDTFDVQRDHVRLIENTARLLEQDGVLIFSNNRRRFKMDLAALSDLNIKDISHITLPKDFSRNPRIHNCWRIQRKSGNQPVDS